MKKVILSLLVIVTLISCGPSDKKQTVKIENKYSLTIPAFLTKAKGLNEEASLQYQNGRKEFYVIVIDDDKEVLVKALEENGLSDTYSNDIKGYSELLLKGFENNINVSKKSEIKDTVINNMKARLINMNGNVIEKLNLNPAIILIHDDVLLYEKSNLRTIVPFPQWDAILPIRNIADVFLYESETPATEDEWQKWLKNKDREKWDLEFDFKYKPSRSGLALRAELDGFDQFTMVLSLSRSGEYWVLGEHDDVEMEGFKVVAAISAKKLTYEEAFPFLMALYHLYYHKLMSSDHSDEEEFEQSVSACKIVEGVSEEAQEKARGYATEIYKQVKDDEEFWKGF